MSLLLLLAIYRQDKEAGQGYIKTDLKTERKRRLGAADQHLTEPVHRGSSPRQGEGRGQKLGPHPECRRVGKSQVLFSGWVGQERFFSEFMSANPPTRCLA